MDSGRVMSGSLGRGLDADFSLHEIVGSTVDEGFHRDLGRLHQRGGSIEVTASLSRDRGRCVLSRIRREVRDWAFSIDVDLVLFFFQLFLLLGRNDPLPPGLKFDALVDLLLLTVFGPLNLLLLLLVQAVTSGRR